MEIWELRSTITKTKDTLVGLKGRMNMLEQRTSEKQKLPDLLIEIDWKKWAEPQRPVDNKRCDTHMVITAVPEWKEKEGGAKNVLEEITVENVPNLVKKNGQKTWGDTSQNSVQHFKAAAERAAEAWPPFSPWAEPTSLTAASGSQSTCLKSAHLVLDLIYIPHH